MNDEERINTDLKIHIEENQKIAAITSWSMNKDINDINDNTVPLTAVYGTGYTRAWRFISKFFKVRF